MFGALLCDLMILITLIVCVSLCCVMITIRLDCVEFNLLGLLYGFVWVLLFVFVFGLAFRFPGFWWVAACYCCVYVVEFLIVGLSLFCFLWVWFI